MMRTLFWITFLLASACSIVFWTMNRRLRDESGVLRELMAAGNGSSPEQTSGPGETGITTASWNRLLDSAGRGDTEPFVRLLEKSPSLATDQLEALVKAADSLAKESKDRRMIHETVLLQLAEQNPPWAAKLSLQRRAAGGLRLALQLWGRDNAKAALEWYRQAQEDGRLQGVEAFDPLNWSFASLLSGIAANDLPLAITLLEEEAPERRAGAISRLAEVADVEGIGELGRHFAGLEDPQARLSGLQTIAEVLGLTNRMEKAGAFLDGLDALGNDEHNQLAAAVVRNVRFEDVEAPEEIGDWLLDHESGVSLFDSMHWFVARWAGTDFDGAAAWLNAQEAAPWRDHAVAAFADQATSSDPRGAVDWAATISNPSLREKTLSGIYTKWPGNDHEDASAYFTEKELALPQPSE